MDKSKVVRFFGPHCSARKPKLQQFRSWNCNNKEKYRSDSM